MQAQSVKSTGAMFRSSSPDFSSLSPEELEQLEIVLQKQVLIENEQTQRLAGLRRTMVHLQQTIQNDDNQNSNQSDELIIHSSNIQLFVIHDDFLISFIEIPNDKINELTTDNQQFISRSTLCRTIIRDLCGRYCWDNYAFNISSNSKAITRPFNNPIG